MTLPPPLQVHCPLGLHRLISAKTKMMGGVRNVLGNIPARGMVAALSLGVLSSCQTVPVVGPGEVPVNLFTYPAPACLLVCTVHISAIREDVSAGASPVTTGAKSVSSSSSTGQQ